MKAGLSSLFTDGPAVYTIPAGRPFLKEVVTTLAASYTDDPLGLSEVTLYLPSRRAVREAARAFLGDDRETARGDGARATLLPRLRALGDVGEEDLLASATPTEAEAMLPPAAEPVERRLVLAALLRQARAAKGQPAPAWPPALAAADELGTLIDEFHLEGVPFPKLAELVSDDDVPRGAEHWEHSLRFLEVVTKVWPDWLSAEGRIEAAERRCRLMQALTAQVEDVTGPVIVAGSLGSVPATAGFMAKVATLPRGLVVLPGLDGALDEEAWKKIEPPHPQALFRTLIEERLGGLGRQDVKPWPCGEDKGAPRRAFLSLVLRPAEATDDWHDKLEALKSAYALDDAVSGLKTAVAANEDEEAGYCALLMREMLETPGKTCMLVTPDRQLARRVEAKLASLGVRVDDSGGVPLGGTYRGTFLRAVARWLSAPSDPSALCAVVMHDLCRLGRTRAEHLRCARAMNRALRGAVPGAGFAGLRRHLTDERRRVTAEEKGGREAALALLARLEEAAAAFQAAGDTKSRLEAHIEAAQTLAATDTRSGEERLWRYEDGEAAAVHLSALLKAGPLLPETDARDYADLFFSLIQGPVVRQRGGTHPRLAILGLLEARLQHADRIILAGLNEGVWPDQPRTDPFLSRPMRAALGLPAPEITVGRAAHDFAELAAAREVFLTRSARRGRSPAEASRWMVRLESFGRSLGAVEDEGARLRTWLAARHAHPGLPRPAPAPLPAPPLEARPVRFSVSEIEVLLRDPYAIYAKKVLNLPVLEPMDRQMDAALRGEFYHTIFHRFAERFRDERPDDPIAALRALAEDLFEERHIEPALRTLWRPRMQVGFEVFARFDAEARALGRLAGAEVSGEWSFDCAGRTYTLRGRADRIDLAPDGRALIVDYKTGGVPTVKQDKSFSPQLALTALMLREGAFDGLPAAQAYRLAYLDSLPKRAGGKVFAGPHTVEEDKVEEHLQGAFEGLKEWLKAFADPARPYPSQPRAFMTNRFGDYDHLARRGEWAGEGEAEEDG